MVKLLGPVGTFGSTRVELPLEFGNEFRLFGIIAGVLCGEFSGREFRLCLLRRDRR